MATPAEASWFGEIIAGVVGAIAGAILGVLVNIVAMRNMFVTKDECKACKTAADKLAEIYSGDTTRQFTELNHRLDVVKEGQKEQSEVLFGLSGQMSLVVDYVKQRMLGKVE